MITHFIWESAQTKSSNNIDTPSQPSVIFYLGLEGMGGLEMDTDEEEDVKHFTLRCVVTYLIILPRVSTDPSDFQDFLLSWMNLRFA